MKVRVYGKINLSLDVVGKTDRMHVLDTIMASVSIADVLSISKAQSLSVVMDGADGTLTNAGKAARLMAERFALPGARIEIATAIPSGWGLGGSSADAAGVIAGLTALYGVAATEEEIEAIAEEVGSDVPFMVRGGCARLRGTARGLTRLPIPRGEVLIVAKGKVDTAAAFKLYDGGAAGHADCERAARLISRGDLERAVPLLGNALTAAAEMLNPAVGEGEAIMRGCGLTAVMTGSGAAIVGYGTAARRQEAIKALTAAGFDCRTARFTAGTEIEG